MRTPTYAFCVRIDVGTRIVRHPFPSGANFRLSVAPLPEPPASRGGHTLAETREFLARFSADAPPYARLTRFRLSARSLYNIYYPPGTYVSVFFPDPGRNFSAFFLGFTQGLELLFLDGVFTLQFGELPL